MALEGAHGTVSIFDKATAPLKSIAMAFKSMGEAAQKAMPAMTGSQKALDSLSATQNRIGRVNAGLQRQTKDIGAQAVGVAALAMSFKSIVQPAIDFESAMADVKKVVDFDTPEQFKQMGKDILNLGKVLPLAHDGIAQLVAAGGQAGFAREELVAFALDAGKMATAFDNLNAKDAGEMMAKWRTAFKMNQDEVRTLADQINYLSNVTASSTTTIADVVTRIGSLGAVAGVSSSNIAAIATTMTSVGVQSEMAATGIQNMLLSMVAGKEATKDQKEAFKSIGMTSMSVAKGMQKDSKATILAVLQGVGKLNKVEQASTLQSLFGKESIKAIAPLLTNLDNLKESFSFVGDSAKFAGSMEKEFQSRSATTENGLLLLTNSVKSLAITFGTILLPPILKTAQAISKFLEPLSDLIEENKDVATAIGAVAAVILIAKLAALGYTATIWLAIPAISALSFALTLIKAPMAVFNALLAANPIGLAVGAILGLIVAIRLLYMNWDKVVAFFSESWTKIKNIFKTQIDFIKTYLGWTPLGMILNNWEPISAFFSDLFEKIGTKIIEFLAVPMEGFKIMADQLKAPFIAVFDWFESKIGFVTSGVAKLGNIAKGASDLFNSQKEGNVWDSMGSVFSSSPSPQSPQKAASAIVGSSSPNVPVTVQVNIKDGKIEDVQSQGATKTNTFLNGGRQF